MRRSALLLLLAAAAFAAPSKKEANLHAKVAQVWADHVLFCKGRKLRADGLESYELASALNPAYDKNGSIKSVLDALPEQADDSPAAATRRLKARAQAAPTPADAPVITTVLFSNCPAISTPQIIAQRPIHRLRAQDTTMLHSVKR